MIDDLERKMDSAVLSGDLKGIQDLLESGAKLSEHTLMLAALKGNSVLVRICIEHGADINMRNEYGFTVLHEALFPADIDTIRYLVEHGADVNALDVSGESVLSSAIRRRVPVRIIDFLKAHGALKSECLAEKQSNAYIFPGNGGTKERKLR